MAQNRKGAGRPKSKVHYKFIPPTRPTDISKEMDRWREIENRMSMPYNPKMQDEFQKKYIGYWQETIEDQTFSNLTENQLQSLLPLFNDYCAKMPLNVEELKDIFNLKTNGLLIKNAKFLAYIFFQLSNANLIADNWQNILREGKTFVSKTGKPINLSSELSNFLIDINGDGLSAKGKLKPTHNRNKRIAKHIRQIINTLCS